MIILKATKNQGFTLSLKRKFLDKQQRGQTNPLAFLGLKINWPNFIGWRQKTLRKYKNLF